MLLLDEQADNEMIQTAMEEKLFAVKKEILTLLAVPSLIKKRQLNLSIWLEAETFVGIGSQEHTQFDSDSPIDKTQDRIAFLESYEQLMSIIKLELMNAGSFKKLNGVVSAALRLQTDYMHGFKKFFAEYTEALPEETKSREMIDTGKLLNALKSNNLTSDITWEIEKELARIAKLPAVN